ncbi:MAG: hypothetical protein AAGF75_01635 [Cyanobacteria bacterium P01_H01_bin.130]
MLKNFAGWETEGSETGVIGYTQEGVNGTVDSLTGFDPLIWSPASY